uniref:hypothetical protein n=1 Tax=Trichocoleus desertorum TaxID=1481672 RepID=UPI0025B37DBA|nr:hypothetical protein [Trichocoleus desertorum]
MPSWRLLRQSYWGLAVRLRDLGTEPPSLEGTCPQTPAEGRLRPPDPLQTSLSVGVSRLKAVSDRLLTLDS